MYKKLLALSVTCLAPLFVHAQDLEISVKSSGGLSAVGFATYLAQTKSPLCKEFTLNDGSPGIIQRRIYEQFKEHNGKVIIPQSIDSHCRYERVGEGSLSFEVADQKSAYNTIDISIGGGNDQEQEIDCKEIMSGPQGDQKMIQCSGEIKTTESGKVSVSVKLK